MAAPKRYRKRPVEIEAMLFTEDNIIALSHWLWSSDCDAEVSVTDDDDRYYLSIPTLEGAMRADLGDYIIRGVAGEFYPCKPDIFKKTYEEVND